MGAPRLDSHVGIARLKAPSASCLQSDSLLCRCFQNGNSSALWHDDNYDKSIKLSLSSLSKDFLLQIFTVFRILIRPEMFPKDWTVMRLVANK